MTSPKRWCVRIVQTRTLSGWKVYEGSHFGPFVECLQHAGLVTIHGTDPNGLTTLCFDVEAPISPAEERPHNLADVLFTDGGKTWAERNAERMRTFGYNAVAAPSTRGDDNA